MHAAHYLLSVLDSKLLRKSPTCTSIPLDLHQIRPEACIRASLGKRAAATCEHMIVDGRTRYPYYYPLHGRPGKRTTRTTRGPASSSAQQVSHEASTRRPSACCLVRRPHACHRIGGDATKIHRPATCAALRRAKSPVRRKGTAMPMRRSYQVTNLGMHACRSLSKAEVGVW